MAIFVIFVIAGVLQAIFPEYAWWIEHGFPENAEPSDLGVLVTRISGVILAIVSAIIFYFILIG